MNKDDLIVKEMVATGKCSDEQVRIGLRAHFRCEYCGLDFYASPENYKQWQRDHIIPLTAGGTETFDNFAASCRTCNYCFKASWDPRKRAGENATRTQLIAVAQDYIRERKQLTMQQLAREKAIVDMP